VLVGTTARIDSSRFQIEGAKILSSGIPQNQLNISDSTALAIDVGGAIGFSGIYSGTSKTTYASIEGNKETADSGNYAGYIRFNTRTHGAGNDERMRIDSSGNVGIGVTPESWGGNFIATQIGDGASLIGRSTDEYAGFASNAYYDSVNDRWEYIGANGSEKATLYEKVNGTHAFYTAPSGSADAAITWTTAMTIDNVGRIIAGTNSSGAHPSWFGTGSSQTGMCIQGGGGGPHVLYLKNNDTSGGANMIQFVDGSGDLCGAINSNATSNTTSYTTSSDYRLKENVVPMTGSIDRLKELNPSRFNFISDPDTIFDGFLAHEAQEIVPECVTGAKDAMMTEEYEVSPAYGEVFTPAVEAIEEVTETVVISQAIEAVDAVTGERQVTITSESEKEVTRTEIVEVNGKWVQTSITETVTNEVSEPQWLDVPLYGEDGEQLQKLITESIEAIVGIEAVEALLDEDGNVVEAAVEAVEAVEAQDSVYEAVTHQIPVMETYEVSPAIEAAAEVTEVNIITEAVEAVAEVILESNVERPENGTWRETTAQVMAEREVPDMQGIDQGKLVPLLVAALQEAIARIEVLEA
jgi:chaperonin cofactor prefoldin